MLPSIVQVFSDFAIGKWVDNKPICCMSISVCVRGCIDVLLWRVDGWTYSSETRTLFPSQNVFQFRMLFVLSDFWFEMCGVFHWHNHHVDFFSSLFLRTFRAVILWVWFVFLFAFRYFCYIFFLTFCCREFFLCTIGLLNWIWISKRWEKNLNECAFYINKRNNSKKVIISP